MHPTIREFPSQHFYDDQLQVNEEEEGMLAAADADVDVAVVSSSVVTSTGAAVSYLS